MSHQQGPSRTRPTITSRKNGRESSILCLSYNHSDFQTLSQQDSSPMYHSSLRKIHCKKEMYNPNARCDYHMHGAGHQTSDCYDLKHKIQDLIDQKLWNPSKDVISTPQSYVHHSYGYWLQVVTSMSMVVFPCQEFLPG